MKKPHLERLLVSQHSARIVSRRRTLGVGNLLTSNASGARSVLFSNVRNRPFSTRRNSVSHVNAPVLQSQIDENVQPANETSSTSSVGLPNVLIQPNCTSVRDQTVSHDLALQPLMSTTIEVDENVDPEDATPSTSSTGLPKVLVPPNQVPILDQPIPHSLLLLQPLMPFNDTKSVRPIPALLPVRGFIKMKKYGGAKNNKHVVQPIKPKVNKVSELILGVLNNYAVRSNQTVPNEEVTLRPGFNDDESFGQLIYSDDSD